MRSLGTAAWLRTITFLLAVALLGSIASAVSAQPSQPFQGDAPTDPGSVVADRAALIQIQGRDDLYEPITPPMAPAYIDWYWGSDQEPFRELVTDFTIHNDVGDWSDTHGYYLILLHNHISDKGVYFGLQTDANRRGKAVIFSRWGTLDLANARWDETNGWTESAGHEGDFIGVRRSYNWGVGDYRIRFAPDSNYSATNGAWFGLWITDLSTTTETWVGSLKFPLKNGTATLDRVHASATIELYGNPPIRPIDIPFWHVSVKRPLGDGVLATRGRTRYPYDDSDNALPNSDVQYASSEGAAHLRLGGMTERTNVGETIDVLSPCANGIAVPDPANNPGLVADCDLLLSARDTLAGTATLDWSADLLIENWDGVTVSGTPPRVTSLGLQHLQLTGTIPAELGSLTNLTLLYLYDNQLIGEIPAELGSLINLETLGLSSNQLSGEIPAELGSLTNLETLRLFNNQLSGEIPAELGSLTNLKTLWLGGNQLSGEIPEELTNLTNLTRLSLGNNQLSGEIPEELTNLTNLTELWLGGNQLSGEIPAELTSLTNLTELWFGNNQLSGEVPAELGSLTNLTWLVLGGNQLSGEIPAELGSLTNLTHLYLYRNQLSGEIPAELGGLTNLTRLDLSGNQLSGEIPAELGGLTNLTRLDLSGNQLSGEIPAELGSLTNLTNLKTLWLSGNQLSGEIPAELGSLTNLTWLVLGGNQLSGEIPAELGGLTNLRWLELSGNQLNGEIPEELGKLTNLIHLYLHGNQLTGPIPSELGSLANLRELWLNDNQLTGSIPTGLGSLANLEELFLSGNQLTGCIPVGIAGVANNDFNQLGLPFCAGALGAPTIGTLTPGADFLTITWAAPTGSPESAIIAYDLRYIETAARDKSDVNWTIVEDVWTAGSGASSYQIAGLTDGTQYDVQMRAVTAAGDGPWSAAATGTPTVLTVVFSDLNWQSAQLQNHIARYIVENGYGYPTNAVSSPKLQALQALRDGDSHVMMEIWLPQLGLAWEEALESGEVLSPGASLGKGWQSAFVIPAYLQAQHPGLDSVEDLKEQRYKDLFKTAETGEKARLVSCVVGWACEMTNAEQVEGYGLADHVHIVNPSNGADLDTSLNDAYERQEPWLGYQWGTSGPALLLDLVRLEEPEYSDECWQTTKACAYEDSTILIGVNASLPDLAPGVVEFLRQWDFSIDIHLRSVSRWQDSNPGASLEDAALYWLGSNVGIWSGWVTGEAATGILATLPLIVRYDANGNGMIEKNEVIAAINDYLFGEGDAAISKAEVIRLINLYLFG